MKQTLTAVIYLISGLIGVVAFAYPFLLVLAGKATAVNEPYTSLLTTILLVICLIILFLEVQGQAVSAKVIAALGVLVAATAVLRFLEVAIPGPGGFSPIFVPIVLAGYVFGSRFGFLMGTLALLTSALVTGGIGPWLPYQMFAVGWVGLTAGWLPHLARSRYELALLVAFSFLWGLFFGLMMNLYFWPFMSDGWQVGASWQQTITDYFAFYMTTSFVWDVARALGNGLFMLALGIPAVKALTRFRNRFQFELVAA